jgi:hypothetical protein
MTPGTLSQVVKQQWGESDTRLTSNNDERNVDVHSAPPRPGSRRACFLLCGFPALVQFKKSVEVVSIEQNPPPDPHRGQLPPADPLADCPSTDREVDGRRFHVEQARLSECNIVVCRHKVGITRLHLKNRDPEGKTSGPLFDMG